MIRLKLAISRYLAFEMLRSTRSIESSATDHRLLVHDELTGLLTSKSFFSELRRKAARAEAETMLLRADDGHDYFKNGTTPMATWREVKRWKKLAP